jgi:hypothetical protein
MTAHCMVTTVRTCNLASSCYFQTSQPGTLTISTFFFTWTQRINVTTNSADCSWNTLNIKHYTGWTVNKNMNYCRFIPQASKWNHRMEVVSHHDSFAYLWSQCSWMVTETDTSHRLWCSGWGTSHTIVQNIRKYMIHNQPNTYPKNKKHYNTP